MESGHLIAALARLTTTWAWPRTSPKRHCSLPWSSSRTLAPGVDVFRRNQILTRKAAELGHALEQDQTMEPDWDAVIDQQVEPFQAGRTVGPVRIDSPHAGLHGHPDWPYRALAAQIVAPNCPHPPPPG